MLRVRLAVLARAWVALRALVLQAWDWAAAWVLRVWLAVQAWAWVGLRALTWLAALARAWAAA